MTLKNLFLVDGASGSTKSNLVRYVEEYNIETKIVRKITNRSLKNYEEKEKSYLDIDFVSIEEFDQRRPEYRYIFNGSRYGFFRKDLDEALNSTSDVFVIVRNADVIQQLQKDYHYINVVPIFIYSDIAKISIHTQYKEDQLAFISDRLDIAFRDYLRHPELYMEVLVDDGTQYLFYRLLDLVRNKYKVSPEVNDKLIFVLMSFNTNNPLLQDYFNAMRRAVKRYDETYDCINLEDFSGSFKIEELAKKNMESCRLAIVDLTENKPNVYYELGYIHAKGTDCIITAHLEHKPAFYPSIYKVVFYTNASELENELYKNLLGVLGKR